MNKSGEWKLRLITESWLMLEREEHCCTVLSLWPGASTLTQAVLFRLSPLDPFTTPPSCLLVFLPLQSCHFLPGFLVVAVLWPFPPIPKRPRQPPFSLLSGFFTPPVSLFSILFLCRLFEPLVGSVLSLVCHHPPFLPAPPPRFNSLSVRHTEAQHTEAPPFLEYSPHSASPRHLTRSLSRSLSHSLPRSLFSSLFPLYLIPYTPHPVSCSRWLKDGLTMAESLEALWWNVCCLKRVSVERRPGRTAATHSRLPRSAIRLQSLRCHLHIPVAVDTIKRLESLQNL